jgi:hypothetical protein
MCCFYNCFILLWTSSHSFILLVDIHPTPTSLHLSTYKVLTCPHSVIFPGIHTVNLVTKAWNNCSALVKIMISGVTLCGLESRFLMYLGYRVPGCKHWSIPGNYTQKKYIVNVLFSIAIIKFISNLVVLNNEHLSYKTLVSQENE